MCLCVCAWCVVRGCGGVAGFRGRTMGSMVLLGGDIIRSLVVENYVPKSISIFIKLVIALVGSFEYL